MAEAGENTAVTGRSCGACCTKLLDFGVALGGRAILDHVNLHLHCGELTALIGPNGAGKTTLLRAMLGELPHTGDIQFIPFGGRPNRRLRIGYVPQRLAVDSAAPISVQDLFAGALSRWPLWLGYRPSVRDETVRALSQVEAADLLDARLGQLSGGQLQRVLLALALTPLPDVLLLDEPMAGIDHAGIVLFYETISKLRQEYDLAVLLISHDLLAIAGVADRMVLLNRTILCDGTPREILSHDLVQRTMGFSLPSGQVPAFTGRHHLHDRPREVSS